MDRRERYANAEETLRMAFYAMQARLWTALPAIVQSFNAAKMTVTAQPTINLRVRQADGTFASVQMPVLLDCPVLWQGGGGVTAVFPIAKGDECLVVFSSRCIDAWWSKGGVQDPTEIRMHNLSDGFVLVGVRSVPNAFTPPAGLAALMSNDGSTYVQLDPVGQTLKMTAPGSITINSNGGVTINGVSIDSSGNVNSPATVTATTDVVGGGKHLKTHIHSGVTAGSANSGPPV